MKAWGLATGPAQIGFRAKKYIILQSYFILRITIFRYALCVKLKYFMAGFSTNKISEDSHVVSRTLRQARRVKKISLDFVSKKLGINLRYLKAMEKGNFSALPEGLYKKNYLRQYAQFLNLDAKKIVEFYEKENPDNLGKKEKKLFSKKIPKAHYFLTIPRLIKNFIIVVIILVCLGYLGYYLNNIIAPPEVVILNPVSDLTINENHISIMGKTEPETEIIINGEMILINSDGLFTKKINLKNGLNIISIIGQKKYSRKNKITKKIIVQ